MGRELKKAEELSDCHAGLTVSEEEMGGSSMAWRHLWCQFISKKILSKAIAESTSRCHHLPAGLPLQADSLSLSHRAHINVGGG